MTGDLVSVAVGYYGGRILFYGGFFLVMLVIMYPWLLLIALWLWWLNRKAETDAAEGTAESHATATGETFGRPVPKPPETSA